jgi:ABC-type transport system involved in cytochrome c biogenesis ATPase subunit
LFSRTRADLVGRAEELQALSDSLSALESGGWIATIRGAAGVGKSRLVLEVAGLARQRGIPVLIASAIAARSTS